MSAALLSRTPSKQLSRRLQQAVRFAQPSPSAGAAGAATDAPDLEAGVSGADLDSPKEGASGDNQEGEGSSSLQALRLRVLVGLKRHFRSKRMSGLLSPAGLRVAT